MTSLEREQLARFYFLKSYRSLNSYLFELGPRINTCGVFRYIYPLGQIALSSYDTSRYATVISGKESCYTLTLRELKEEGYQPPHFFWRSPAWQAGLVETYYKTWLGNLLRPIGEIETSPKAAPLLGQLN